MTNIETKIEGNKLILIVDLSQRHNVSKSGNTVAIAGTNGNQKLPGKHEHISFGLTVYTKEGLDKAKKDQNWQPPTDKKAAA